LKTPLHAVGNAGFSPYCVELIWFSSYRRIGGENLRVLRRRLGSIARTIDAAGLRRNLHPIFPRHCIPSLMKYAG
jgi:hypothetical protein